MRTAFCIAILFCSFSFSNADEIVGFRGDGTATYRNCKPPTEWSAESEKIVWKAELGQGYSSPVLIGDRVVLTSRPSDVVCFDAATGKEAWRFHAGYELALGKEKSDEIAATYEKLNAEKNAFNKKYNAIRKADPDSPELDDLKKQRKVIDDRRKDFEKKFPSEKRGGAGNAAATVLCDGKNLFALFGTGILVALDLEGNLLWAKHLEAPLQGFGHSASPIMANGNLIVHIQNMMAIDPANGEIHWTAKVPAKFGTPASVKIGKSEIVISASGWIVDATNGNVLAEKQFRLSHNSPIVEDGIIYAHESGKVKAFRLPNSIESPFELELLWQSSGTSDQRMATAVLHEGLLYAAGRKGIIDVTDAKTGDLIYRERSGVGEIFSSPVIADGHVFLAGKNDKTLVFRAGREFKEVSENKLGRVTTLPVFKKDKMFIRTDKALFCIQR